MDERHKQAAIALSVILHEAQGVRDVKRSRYIDIGGEVGTVRAVLNEYRTALAEVTERAEAAEGYIAKIEAIRGKKLGVPCCCDFADDDSETPIVECGYHRAVREERDAAIVRADALAARLAEVDDREHPA